MRIFFLISLSLTLAIFSACMKDKPESFPENLVWNPELAFPVGMDSLGMNAESGFDTTLFELDTLTGLPLWVNEVQIVMEGSVDFDLSAMDGYLDSANQILFRLNIRNGFPDDAHAQAYFLNASNDAIDSMFSEGPLFLPGGSPIDEGAKINPSHVGKDAIFSRERIIALEEAREILFRAILPIEGLDTILFPYYPNYSLEMEIGIMADLTFSL